MKIRATLLALGLVAMPLAGAHAASPEDRELCKQLRSFVRSVGPDEKREVVLRTSWGENFKDAPEQALSAKRCEHNGYEPAQALCTHLMEHTSTEFAGSNVKRVISCLSSKTRFVPGFRLHSGSFSFSHGSSDRGAWINITLAEDPELGGMAFRLQADGY